MELWFSELHTPNVKISIRVDRQLHSEQSEFQRIDVYESPEFGRFLTLDGYMMLTEKDEFIYHEMITHVPMAVHPHVKKVLVIGAGDGGVVRELTRYQGIEQIDMVEIDRRVVEVCKEYLPQTACCFDDPRVQLTFADGLKFIRSKEDEYDLIIVIHAVSYFVMCLHVLNNDTGLNIWYFLAFYIGQLAYILVMTRIIPRFIRLNAGLNHVMIMMLTIGFVIQTRLSFDSSLRQFIIVLAGTVLSLIFCLIQALVFTMLLSIYVSEAVEEEE